MIHDCLTSSMSCAALRFPRESGFLTLVIDYKGTVRLEVELADLFAWVRDVRRTLSGLNMISTLKPQGCRCAPTAGLKLANAFGVGAHGTSESLSHKLLDIGVG